MYGNGSRMTDLFKELIPSILVSKEDVLENEKDYNAYIVNRALSFHADCILHVNELNVRPSIDSRMQYLYLLNSIRGYKRKFVPWTKRENIQDIEMIQQYFGFSRAKAKDAMSVLSEKEINEIRINSDKGGVSKNVDSRRHGRSPS